MAEHQFTIHVNGHEIKTDADALSGAQIKALAGVPADYELFEVKGSETVPIGNEQSIDIRNGEHLRAIPAGTFGTYAAAA